MKKLFFKYSYIFRIKIFRIIFYSFKWSAIKLNYRADFLLS